MPDCELLLIDIMLPAPGAADTLAELRRDPRTAQIPVAIVTRPEMEERAIDIVRNDPLAAVWIRPMDRRGIDAQLEPLEQRVAAAGVRPGSPELRLRQATAAMDWLLHLIETRPQLYDFRGLVSSVERTLHLAQLSTRASSVLGQIPSPQAQRAVVELASSESTSVAARKAAAAAFAESVGRYGCQLTTVEMQRQYDRYNDSEFKDETTQKILGSMLDVIEAGRAPKLAGARK
jgi:hypothetical protein